MAPFDDFSACFERATGFAPYGYQRRLAAGPVPSVLEVPTGAGKTQALLVAWLHQRLVRGAGPRRLVYALPMRALVEQTALVARSIRDRLDLSGDELPVHVLMGGEAPTDWREHPARPQILIGTVDMLLSRALNRGYGEGRFQWPVAYGLLNNDCRWIFDEVQLMGPARATSAQLDGLRTKLGTALRCETIWASATVDRKALATVDRPDLGPVLGLSAEDRAGPLAQRLDARKRIERVVLAGGSRIAATIAEAVLQHHLPATRSIVVLNRVTTAQEVFDAVRRLAGTVAQEPADVVLLHSRFRPPERAARMAEALAAPGPGGTIVVATQVIEAGVDVSSRLLATETAPFSSIVQRLGRCNRAGEHEEATVLWLDSGEADARGAAPYRREDLSAARAALASLEGRSASPEVLAGMNDVSEHRTETAVLRRRDLIDLFDTGPDLSGMDVDVSRFIRDGDERTVAVFFRRVDPGELGDQVAPDGNELVDVPIGDLRQPARRSWTFDHVDGTWTSVQADALRPGMTLMLDATQGGYNPLQGWRRVLMATVDPIAPRTRRDPEAIGSDSSSAARQWMALTEHLERAEQAAHDLLATLGELDLPAGAASSAVAAAALHDIGKAHPVFQATLLGALDDEERARRVGTVWAKSAGGFGRHRRRHFRHELASGLAVRQLDGEPWATLDRRDLVGYLVAAHHGRVRLSIRPAPNERPPPDVPRATRFALGIVEGDVLPAVETPRGRSSPATLRLACMELGGGEAGHSWTAAACELRDDRALGVFRLAFLEALVRVADWRASA
jgi:CRISPR-associated endonuclease/helicase Cas3